MIERRNRNGGRRAPDEDAGSDLAGETIALERPEVPVEEPIVEPKGPAPPAPEAPPPRTRGLAKRLFVLLLVVAAAALLYRYWGFWQGQPTSPAAPPPPAVTVSKPLIREIQEWADFTGQFEAREAVEVRPRVSGYLESINFTDGQLVKKGDLLFVIEPPPLQPAR